MVGVHVILNSTASGLSPRTCNGTIFCMMKSATLSLGYVTAPICLQPIQPGLKKSSRIGFFSACPRPRALVMSDSQVIMAFPPFRAICAVQHITGAFR